MMSAFNQEWIALGIVAVAAFAVTAKVSRAILLMPLAKLLLKTGHVKWAMKIHRLGGPKVSPTQGNSREKHKRTACGKC